VRVRIASVARLSRCHFDPGTACEDSWESLTPTFQPLLLAGLNHPSENVTSSAALAAADFIQRAVERGAAANVHVFVTTALNRASVRPSCRKPRGVLQVFLGSCQTLPFESSILPGLLSLLSDAALSAGADFAAHLSDTCHLVATVASATMTVRCLLRCGSLFVDFVTG
jgi:hypothetical protein